MASIKFDPTLATQGLISMFIDRGGIYNVIINKATYFKNSSGAAGIEFTFGYNGSAVRFVRVYTKRKDGTKAFGLNKIHALLGLLGITELPAETNGDETEFPLLYGREIAVKLKRVDYYKKGGGVGFKFDVEHFLCPTTLKTYTEKINGLPARVKDEPVEYEPLPRTNSVPVVNSSGDEAVDAFGELPF